MLSRIRITHKLTLAFSGLIVAFSIASYFVVAGLAAEGLATAAVRNNVAATAAARALFASFVAEQNYVRGYVIGQHENLLQDVARERVRYDETLAAMRAVESDPSIQADITEADHLLREWRIKSADRQVALARDPTTRVQATAFVNGSFAGRISAAIDRAIGAEALLTARHNKIQDRSANVVKTALAVTGLATVTLAIVLCWLLNRAIAVPVRAMAIAMRELAAGNTEVSIPAAAHRDELGDMSAAVRVFRDAELERRKLEAVAATARAEAETERSHAEAVIAAHAQAQGLVVSSLGECLSSLSSGDLTIRIDDEFAPDYLALRSHFNEAVNALDDALGLIVTRARDLHSGANEILGASDALSESTERQAASLEQTAAALAEITATVRRTADGAKQASRTVASARSNAERSGQVVEQAVLAMGEIQHSAMQISQIIGVIDEIAFQTNLLALNAGVEAARAGDAGRGFAVVASEVRALAQRSADAAKQIKALINDSTRLVGRGVTLVGETGSSLTRIALEVSEINAVVAQIAQSAEEQAIGLLQINQAVDEMDQATQRNAAAVGQSNAAYKTLVQDADEIASLTARFGTSGAALRRKSAPASLAVAI